MFHNSYVEREAIENANQQEELVPIRIDMELEGQKLRDCFVWNRNERLITPEAFAEAMCDDLKGIFARKYAKNRKNPKFQLIFQSHLDYLYEQLPILSDHSVEIFNQVMKYSKSQFFIDFFEANFGFSANEARVIVKLNVVVGNILLEDQIEWDMSER